MLKKCLVFTILIFIMCSQLFGQEDNDLSFLNPIMYDYNYSYHDEDSIELSSKYHGSRKRRSRSGTSNLSFDFDGMLLFSLVGLFSEYSIDKDYKTYASESDYKTYPSELDSTYTFTPNNKKLYSFLLGLKMGFNFDRYTTYSIFAVDLLAFERDSFDFDSRFGVDIAFSIYEEIISFVISPYFSMRLASGIVGTITESSKLTTSTYDAEVNQFSFGIGALAGLKFRFTERFGMTLMGGYVFYFANIGGESTFGAEYYLNINGLNLSNWEASASIDVFF